MFKSMFVFLFLALAIVNGCSQSPSSGKSPTPVTQKVPGFLGLYTNYNGTIYGGWGWTSGKLLQTAFNFGINTIVNVANLDGYSFQTNVVNSCTIWNTNKVYGILAPPVGHDAIVNQPGDTALLQPFAQTPGMIQGAHRFSELSKVYPQISGVIIDDFGGSFGTAITLTQLRAIRDALEGKSLDASGNVVDTSQATTPDLKLYVVDYQSGPLTDQSIKDVIDGVVLFVDNDQNVNYQNLDHYVNAVKQTYPGIETIVGVDCYIDKTPTGIRSLIQNSTSLYDQGDVNGVLLFAGWWLVRQSITLGRWDSLAMPPFLDSLYYPKLGMGTGTVFDAGTGDAVANALVTVQRVIGTKTQLVTRKLTSSSGQYDFGGWTGNSSSVYTVEIAKPPYLTQTFYARLQPGLNVMLPDVKLAQ